MRVEAPTGSATNAFNGQEMSCILCDRKQRSNPNVESDWRGLELDGTMYYVCPEHFPPDTGTVEEFKAAYVAAVERAIELRGRPEWSRNLSDKLVQQLPAIVNEFGWKHAMPPQWMGVVNPIIVEELQNALELVAGPALLAGRHPTEDELNLVIDLTLKALAERLPATVAQFGGGQP